MPYSEINRESLLWMYEKMVTIRRFEEQSRREADAGKLRGMHSAVGQEAVPTGICAHLRDDDYVLGIKNNIDIIQTVEDDGKYNHHALGFEGEHIYKVDSKIAEKLNNFSKLLFKGTLRHSYPHSWRSKAPLIYRNTPQSVSYTHLTLPTKA